MNINPGPNYLSYLYRFTLFYLLAREIYSIAVEYLIPFLDELIAKEQHAVHTLQEQCDALVIEQIQEEKKLAAYMIHVKEVEEKINRWNEQLQPQKKLAAETKINFIEKIRITRNTAYHNFQVTRLQKKLLSQVFYKATYDLSNSQTSMNETTSMNAFIEQFKTQSR